MRRAKPALSLEEFYEAQLDRDLHPDVRRAVADWRAAQGRARELEREREEQLNREAQNDEIKEWGRWLVVRLLCVLVASGAAGKLVHYVAAALRSRP